MLVCRAECHMSGFISRMHNLSAIVGNTKVGHSLGETPGRGLLQVRLGLKKFSLVLTFNCKGSWKLLDSLC